MDGVSQREIGFNQESTICHVHACFLCVHFSPFSCCTQLAMCSLCFECFISLQCPMHIALHLHSFSRKHTYNLFFFPVPSSLCFMCVCVLSFPFVFVFVSIRTPPSASFPSFKHLSTWSGIDVRERRRRREGDQEQWPYALISSTHLDGWLSVCRLVGHASTNNNNN